MYIERYVCGESSKLTIGVDGTWWCFPYEGL